MEYKLPDLHKYWAFPRIMSPWHSEVTPVSADWTESFNIFSPAHARKFRGINVGLLASLAYPHHTKEQLRQACDLMNVLFAMDDVTDVLSPEEVRSVSEIALDALRNPEKKRPEGEHPIGELHRSFWSRTLKVSSKTVARRFIKSYEAYVTAVIAEAEDRNNTTIRKNIDDYLTLRRFTGAIKPSYDLMLMPMEIPDSVLLDQRIVDLEFMSIDMVAVANDIVSFNAEQARGDIHNAVIVVMNQYNFSVQEGMDYVCRWYHNRANEFMRAMTDLPECPDIKTRDQLKEYVYGLGNWVTANYEWSFGSKRFFGNEIETVKETGKVLLRPANAQVAVAA
ncbi:isoprenoid synthase domain-containing protein [Gautieria morchelliformis]|nr:isoprenoid synthase domain-containing protein [Gautieria morchelliformis]